MTTVRAQCPACGDVKLRIHDLTVRVCADLSAPGPSTPGESTAGVYRFRCPICRETVHRTASARIVDLLVSAGASQELWRWPAELAERPDGPALTPDDLLDLHVLLADDGWFDGLVALVRRTTPE